MPLRVLIAHAAYRVAGGEDRYVEQQLSLLEPHHEVRLFGARNDELSGGPQTFARMTYARDLTGELEDAIESFRPDLVHLHNPYPALGPAVHVATDRKRVPLVQTVHNHRLRCPNGYMFTEGELCTRCEAGNYLNATLHRCFPARSQAAAYATSLWTHRFVLKTDDKVRLFIAPSHYMAARLEGWGIASERITTVPNFTDAPAKPDAARTGGIFVGRLSAEKGLDVLLHALHASGDPPFVIVGGGPAETEVRTLAGRLELARCDFTGALRHEEVQARVAGASYFVMPSLWHENAPLAVLEAMAAGLALIVTDRGGLPELAKERGMIVPAGDPVGLAGAIATLNGEDDTSRSFGSACARYAQAELTPEIHRARLEAAYERALASP